MDFKVILLAFYIFADGFPGSDLKNPDTLDYSSLAETKIPQSSLVNKTNIKEYVAQKGYRLEEHALVTEDGYRLTYHRISAGKEPEEPSSTPSKYPVLLQHSLITSSADFLVPDKNALAYVLVDAGFDVWLGNSRGNWFSRGHVSLDPEKNISYWNFTQVKMSLDVAAGIDYILNATRDTKVLYVGHSHGAIYPLILGALRPEYMTKVAILVALAPAAYLKGLHLKNTTATVVGDHTLRLWKHMVNQRSSEHRLFVDAATAKNILKTSTTISSHPNISIDNVLELLRGTVNPDALKEIDNLHPFGTSTAALYSLEEHITDGELFTKDDIAVAQEMSKNLDLNLTSVIFPVHLFFSEHDMYVTPQDIDILKSTLKVVELHPVKEDKFNHMDFVWGTNAKKLVFQPIVDILSGVARLATRRASISRIIVTKRTNTIQQRPENCVTMSPKSLDKLLNDLEKHRKFLGKHGFILENQKHDYNTLKNLAALQISLQFMTNQCSEVCKSVLNILRTNDWFEHCLTRDYLFSEIENEIITYSPVVTFNGGKSDYDQFLDVLYKYEDYFHCKYGINFEENETEDSYLRKLFVVLHKMSEGGYCERICQDILLTLRKNSWFRGQVKALQEHGDYNYKETYTSVLQILTQHQKYLKTAHKFILKGTILEEYVLKKLLDIKKSVQKNQDSCNKECEAFFNDLKMNMWFMNREKQFKVLEYDNFAKKILQYKDYIYKTYGIKITKNDNKMEFLKKLSELRKRLLDSNGASCIGECSVISDMISSNLWLIKEAEMDTHNDYNRNLMKFFEKEKKYTNNPGYETIIDFIQKRIDFIIMKYNIKLQNLNDESSMYNILYQIVVDTEADQSKGNCKKCKEIASFIRNNEWFQYYDKLFNNRKLERLLKDLGRYKTYILNYYDTSLKGDLSDINGLKNLERKLDTSNELCNETCESVKYVITNIKLIVDHNLNKSNELSSYGQNSELQKYDHFVKSLTKYKNIIAEKYKIVLNEHDNKEEFFKRITELRGLLITFGDTCLGICKEVLDILKSNEELTRSASQDNNEDEKETNRSYETMVDFIKNNADFIANKYGFNSINFDDEKIFITILQKIVTITEDSNADCQRCKEVSAFIRNNEWYQYQKTILKNSDLKDNLEELQSYKTHICNYYGICLTGEVSDFKKIDIMKEKLESSENKCVGLCGPINNLIKNASKLVEDNLDGKDASPHEDTTQYTDFVHSILKYKSVIKIMYNIEISEYDNKEDFLKKVNELRKLLSRSGDSCNSDCKDILNVIKNNNALLESNYFESIVYGTESSKPYKILIDFINKHSDFITSNYNIKSLVFDNERILIKILQKIVTETEHDKSGCEKCKEISAFIRNNEWYLYKETLFKYSDLQINLKALRRYKTHICNYYGVCFTGDLSDFEKIDSLRREINSSWDGCVGPCVPINGILKDIAAANTRKDDTDIENYDKKLKELEYTRFVQSILVHKKTIEELCKIHISEHDIKDDMLKKASTLYAVLTSYGDSCVGICRDILDVLTNNEGLLRSTPPEGLVDDTETSEAYKSLIDVINKNTDFIKGKYNITSLGFDNKRTLYMILNQIVSGTEQTKGNCEKCNEISAFIRKNEWYQYQEKIYSNLDLEKILMALRKYKTHIRNYYGISFTGEISDFDKISFLKNKIESSNDSCIGPCQPLNILINNINKINHTIINENGTVSNYETNSETLPYTSFFESIMKYKKDIQNLYNIDISESDKKEDFLKKINELNSLFTNNRESCNGACMDIINIIKNNDSILRLTSPERLVDDTGRNEAYKSLIDFINNNSDFIKSKFNMEIIDLENEKYLIRILQQIVAYTEQSKDDCDKCKEISTFIRRNDWYKYQETIFNNSDLENNLKALRRYKIHICNYYGICFTGDLSDFEKSDILEKKIESSKDRCIGPCEKINSLLKDINKKADPILNDNGMLPNDGNIFSSLEYTKFVQSILVYKKFIESSYKITINEHDNKDDFLKKISTLNTLLTSYGDSCVGVCKDILDVIRNNYGLLRSTSPEILVDDLEISKAYKALIDFINENTAFIISEYNIKYIVFDNEKTLIRILQQIVSDTEQSKESCEKCKEISDFLRRNEWYQYQEKLFKNPDIEKIFKALRKYKIHIRIYYDISLEGEVSDFDKLKILEEKIETNSKGTCEGPCESIKGLIKYGVNNIESTLNKDTKLSKDSINSNFPYTDFVQSILKYKHIIADSYKIALSEHDEKDVFLKKLSELQMLLNRNGESCTGDCKRILDIIKDNDGLLKSTSDVNEKDTKEAYKKLIVFIKKYEDFIIRKYNIKSIEFDNENILVKALHQIVRDTEPSKRYCDRCKEIAGFIRNNEWYQYQEKMPNNSKVDDTLEALKNYQSHIHKDYGIKMDTNTDTKATEEIGTSEYERGSKITKSEIKTEKRDGDKLTKDDKSTTDNHKYTKLVKYILKYKELIAESYRIQFNIYDKKEDFLKKISKLRILLSNYGNSCTGTCKKISEIIKKYDGTMKSTDRVGKINKKEATLAYEGLVIFIKKHVQLIKRKYNIKTIRFENEDSLFKILQRIVTDTEKKHVCDICKDIVAFIKNNDWYQYQEQIVHNNDLHNALKKYKNRVRDKYGV